MEVILVGLGPIGIAVGEALVKKQIPIVGAVDLRPELAGRALNEVVAGASPLPITSSLPSGFQPGHCAIILTTTSKFSSVVPDLERAIAARLHAVSTCEEMALPDAAHAQAVHALDEKAKAAGVTLLGTGVNPGFVMDRLVLSLSGTQVQTDRVQVTRIVDAAKRRGPLRKKVGEGLSEAEWRSLASQGRIGHVGLEQSARLVALGLGWIVDHYSESLDPVVRDGVCRGLKQIGRATVNGKELITLELQMYAGATDPGDHIILDGDPPIDAFLRGGVQGDRGTVGTVVRALERLERAPRGLVTVADVFT